MNDNEMLPSAGNATKSLWMLWLPHVLVAFWLFYLGAAIWQHALHSVQSPYYDPLSYYQKAVNFWREVDKTLLFNPFSLEPTVRPPGTVLMSLPFGLASDFHGFYFRSVFLPILSIALSVYIVAGTDRLKICGWQVAGIVFLLSSLPMFYWMDWYQDRYANMGWGMVDNFQAGIAAMAVAAILRSQITKSIRWVLFGALLASFTLMIKPSGLMVMVLTLLIWLAAIAFEWIGELRLHRPTSLLRKHAFAGGIGFLLLYSAALILCLSSKYFSSSNLSYAVRALEVMRKTLVNSSLLPLFHLSAGEFMPLWVFLVTGLLVWKMLFSGGEERRTLRISTLLLGAAIITWLAGSWYWLVVQSGENQIRYFYPFLLMGCICLVPAALMVWPDIRKSAGRVLLAICFLPAINMAALLAAGDAPSMDWQYLTGVSVSVGQGKEEVMQAYDFLKAVRKEQKEPKIYFFPNNIDLQTSFAVVGPYEKLVRPDLPSFSLVGPIDWIRGFAVRTKEMLECDYVLLNKCDEAYVKAYLSLKQVDTFDAESRAFESWMLEQSGRWGLEAVSEGRKLLLLQITNREALSSALDQFVSQRGWRPEFYSANKALYWDSASALAAAGKVQLQEIGFDGIFKLHALAIKEIARGIQIDVWWEELRHEEANEQRYLFFHIVDASGKILYNQQISLFPYDPPASDKRWQHGSLTFEGILPNGTLKSIALGIYQPSGPFLFPDRKLASDWEGRRILIPLSAIAGTFIK